VKDFEGNPGKRKTSGAKEAKPKNTKPTCPQHVQGEARREWNRIAKDLHAAGLLTKIDKAALATYCVAWGRWVDAENQLRKHGPIVKARTGFPIQNPWCAIANKAMQQMQKAMTELGMTPSSRTRIHVETPDSEDALDSFLKLTG
jgi:P27 family predicted phage terminase small subunit